VRPLAYEDFFGASVWGGLCATGSPLVTGAAVGGRAATVWPSLTGFCFFSVMGEYAKLYHINIKSANVPDTKSKAAAVLNRIVA
jgi:hypothetical protein